MSKALLPCPFCGQPLFAQWDRMNPRARCKTPSCKGAQLPLLNLDSAEDIAAWNHRIAPAPGTETRKFKGLLRDLGVHPSKKLAQHCTTGDDSFCLVVQESLYDQFCPLPEGYVYDFTTAIRLKMRNVEPHTDYPLSTTPDGCEYVGSVFCALTLRSPYLMLQVGEKSQRLVAGQWVLFDDQTVHSVIAEKQWSGVAVQVFKKIDAPS